MISESPRTGYRAPARRPRPAREHGIPLLPPLDFATTLRIRVVLGTILSVAVVGCAVLLSAPGGSGADPVRLAAANPVPLAVDEALAVPDPTGSAPASVATSSIDGSYIRAASTCPGLDPAVLAAIHTIETRRGRDRRVSVAGAVGPMQFLPATWAHYGIDGNGDGRADIRNFSDAVFSAARYLCANGGADPERLPTAVWNYNHSQAYVSAVLQLAQRLSA